jgi:hypothetical protein
LDAKTAVEGVSPILSCSTLDWEKQYARLHSVEARKYSNSRGMVVKAILSILVKLVCGKIMVRFLRLPNLVAQHSLMPEVPNSGK